MPQAVFVIHLDDYYGIVVVKKHPLSLSLYEKTLSSIFYEHEKEEKESLRYTETDNLRMVSFVDKSHPNWMACFVLTEEENYEALKDEIPGMGRLAIELVIDCPKIVRLDEILKNHSSLEEPNEEQKYAQMFLTPSSTMVLEKIEKEGVERASKLSLWLKTQVQSDSSELRESILPLMDTGIVKVEVVGKGIEAVFLVKDLFVYRAPPVDAIMGARESVPELASNYEERVAKFFAPPPPSKGYNPSLPSDDPNSPLVEDREKIAEVLSNKIDYKVLTALRDQPLSVSQICEKTLLQDEVVQRALYSLESDDVAAQIGEGIWALVANPVMECFIPEYVLQLIAEKLANEEIDPEIAKRHLEILAEKWSVEQ
jgi:DNA-binding transcriptional ArsR family regulator